MRSETEPLSYNRARLRAPIVFCVPVFFFFLTFNFAFAAGAANHPDKDEPFVVLPGIPGNPEKDKDEDSENSKAAVVDLNQRQLPGTRLWSLPIEEPPPPSFTRAAKNLRGDDPERVLKPLISNEDENEDDGAARPGAHAGDGSAVLPNKPQTTPRLARKLNDPEAMRKIPDGDAGDTDVMTVAQAPALSLPNGSLPAGSAEHVVAKHVKSHYDDPETFKASEPDPVEASADPHRLESAPPEPANLAPAGIPAQKGEGLTPRFTSGRGLDSEAAEKVAEMALAERRQALAAANPPPAPAVPVVAPKPESEKTVAANPGGAAATPQGGTPSRSGTGKPGEAPMSPAAQPKLPAGQQKLASAKAQEDPEQRFKEIIKQIEENNKTLEKLSEKRAQQELERGGDNNGVHSRDKRATWAIDALSNKTPLGILNGRIVDPKGKLIPARVQIIDLSNTPVNASLDEGFWCGGQYNARVFSGPVKVQVSHGRFSPTYLKGVEVKPGLMAECDVAIGKANELKFTSRGWFLADLDIGLRRRVGERSLWLGKPPTIQDLLSAARAEDVHILGVPVPWGDLRDPKEIAAVIAQQDDMVLLPVFPGPTHAFYGCGMGLGVKSWDELPRQISLPETPLRDSFEAIRDAGGLAVYKNLAGLSNANIKHDIFTLFPRLEQTGYYADPSGSARMFAASELPFDTVVGPAYDLFAFDGSALAEQLWFNLITQGYPVSVIGAAGGSLEGGRVPYGQTFIHLEGKPTRENVMEGIKKGHTSISFGPAAFCKILERDMGPGSVLPADGRLLTLQIQAYASMEQAAQIDKIEIIRNGEVVHVQNGNDGESQIDDFRWPVSERMSAWYVVRVTERHGSGPTAHKGGTAWTSPIYFRGVEFASPMLAQSNVSGILRRGLTPVEGKVTAVVPGQPSRIVTTDVNGYYKVQLPASGILIFEAAGCEPRALHVFEHPKVQRALGALQSGDETVMQDQFAKPSLFPAWTLLLSDLNWDVSLNPK